MAEAGNIKIEIDKKFFDLLEDIKYLESIQGKTAKGYVNNAFTHEDKIILSVNERYLLLDKKSLIESLKELENESKES